MFLVVIYRSFGGIILESLSGVKTAKYLCRNKTKKKENNQDEVIVPMKGCVTNGVHLIKMADEIFSFCCIVYWLADTVSAILIARFISFFLLFITHFLRFSFS